MVRNRHRALAPWLAMAAVTAAPRPIAAQVAQTYVVKQAGREIGREHLTISGSSLRIETSYPGANTHVEAQLDRGTDGAVATFRLRASGPDAGTVAAAGNGARLVLRTTRGGAETARELPGGRAVVVLDDHAYTLYQALADIAAPGGTPIVAVMPRTGRRMKIVARRDGSSVTLSGDLVGTITLDANAHLERIELPDQQISITRVTG